MHVRLLLVLALAAAVGGTALALAERDQENVALHLLDVGQGDAILLRSGASDMLIDGGPDARVLQRLSEVRPGWDRTLDILVLTHPQRDHLAGLLPVLERFRVSLVLLPPLRSDTDLFASFVARIQEQRIPVRFAQPGQQVRAGGAVLTVLAPDAHARRLAERNVNNGSLVLRADLRDARNPGMKLSFLLTGDAERAAEQLLVRRFPSMLDVDVLKLPHHGSRTSSSLPLLRAATPSIALVSVGAGNRYGHPAPGVLRRLGSLRLLRTDQEGTISLVLRGGRMLLRCAAHRCATLSQGLNDRRSVHEGMMPIVAGLASRARCSVSLEAQHHASWIKAEAAQRRQPEKTTDAGDHQARRGTARADRRHSFPL